MPKALFILYLFAQSKLNLLDIKARDSCAHVYDLAQKVVLSDTSTREEINEFLRLRGIVNQCLLSLIDNPGEGKNDRLAFRGCAGCQYNGPTVKKFYS